MVFMKLEKLQEMILDTHLQEALWGSSYAADRETAHRGEKRDVSQKDLVLHLFSSEHKEVDILLVVEALVSATTQKGSSHKLLAKIMHCAADDGEKKYGMSKELIDRIVTTIGSAPSNKPQKTEDAGAQSVPALITPFLAVDVQYDQFPEQWCSFEDLYERSVRLKSTLSEGQGIIDEIKRRVQADPLIASLSTLESEGREGVSRFNPPYDVNRAARQIPGAYVNGSDVYTSLQNFLIMGCPRGARDTSDFFDTVLQQGIKVLVSLHQRDEAQERYHDFWENSRLETLTLRDGWSIKKVNETVLDQKEMEEGGTRVPRIVESTLLATRGEESVELTHLHYDGWRDKNPMPSEELLETLYRRVEMLSPSPKTPVAINCKGGVGRSGTCAVGLYVRRYIRKALVEGVDLRVNIPEIIYREFRRRRSGIIGQPTQLAQVYSMAAQYYQRVKKAYEQMLASFPRQAWPLGELHSVRERLVADDYAQAKALQLAINKRIKKDISVLSLRPTSSTISETPTSVPIYDAAYHENRLARHIPGLFLNWSDIKTPRQRYFAGGCPGTIDGVSGLFESVVREGARTMVSFHQPGEETSDRCNMFWQEATLKQLRLPEGWVVENRASKLLDERSLPPGGIRVPRIVESTLLATCGEKKFEVQHFHYDGWVDRSPMPSMDLFRRLMKEIKTLSFSPADPIAVNCRGGVGRTGVFLVAHYLLDQIIQNLRELKGAAVGEITVNLAEVIYMFRKERRSVLGGYMEFCEVVDYLAGIYDEIRALGVERFLAEYQPKTSTLQ